MELSHEDIVTKLLSDSEILNGYDAPDMLDVGNRSEGYMSVNSKYDLTNYLNNVKSEPSRFGEKYIFVR